MTRWRLFWLSVLAALGAVDAWREQCDIAAGRTHTTGTTLSASTRWTVERLPFGRWIFAALCVAIPFWFLRHILNYLDDRRADW